MAIRRFSAISSEEHFDVMVDVDEDPEIRDSFTLVLVRDDSFHSITKATLHYFYDWYLKC